jgi:hypothetical protein
MVQLNLSDFLPLVKIIVVDNLNILEHGYGKQCCESHDSSGAVSDIQQSSALLSCRMGIQLLSDKFCYCL